MEESIVLRNLSDREVPLKLKKEYYFDFKKYPFEHSGLFELSNNVVGVVYEIENYARKWLKKKIDYKLAKKSAKLKGAGNFDMHRIGKFEVWIEDGAVFKPASIVGIKEGQNTKLYRIYIEKGARVFAADIFLEKGDIYIGSETNIEPGVGIKGPTIIGKKNDIRSGAYFRGSIIIGNGGTFRGELKNVVMMDKTNFPHSSYVGDSICGYQSHFGNQATTANFGIFEGIRDKDKRKNIVLNIDGKYINTGKSKLGIILGDFSQVGCNSVSDPGSFLAPYTIVYPLTRIKKGFYGPNQILKNKVFEKGIIEILNLNKE